MNNTKFKVNQAVTVNATGSIWYGQKGTVDEIDQSIIKCKHLYSVHMYVPTAEGGTRSIYRSYDENDLIPYECPLDRQDFYELMQAYRHCPTENQQATIQYFNDVKAYIRKHLKDIEA